MPLQATSGAASYDAFGGGVAAVPTYIEDVFSTYLYTGNGSTQTITNGIDLAGKGGMVWWKNRTNATGHGLIDTTRGIDYYLSSNTTDAQDGPVSYISSVSSTGYSIGVGTQFVNQSANNYASWTFRKQPKFFDVVTWTGNGGASQTISHNLGSAPGCIIAKGTSTVDNWWVYHRSASGTPLQSYLRLNNTSAAATGGSDVWGATSTTITVDSSLSLNTSGQTYVAYVFAHNAGGFGLTGTDNVISCGSYTGNGSASGPTISLGYEPQWVMIKNATDATNWAMFDNMRGIATGGTEQRLYANTSGAEVTTSGNDIDLTATGFNIKTDLGYLNTSGSTFIYMAIRRGPMKVPTSGTSVFNSITRTGTGATANITGAGFPPDMIWNRRRNAGYETDVNDKLRGAQWSLFTSYTSEETNFGGAPGMTTIGQDGCTVSTDGSYNGSGGSFVLNFWRRAPSFFDEVCYTGNGSSNNAKTHNLGVAPELLIIKNRSSSASGDWYTFHTFTSSNFKKQLLDTTDSQTNYTYGSFLDAQPTSTTFTVNSGAGCNESGVTYVAYLFATCAGVSKVGSYTGTGTTKQVDCGFTGGARFVLIKRTDSDGDWYVWDSARGIVAGNDPYLLLNSTAAEVTNTDYIDTYSAGFEISSTAPAAINASGGTFIFLAIA